MIDSVTIGVIGIGIVLVLVFLKVPIGAALAIIGFGGFACLRGIDPALSSISLIPFVTVHRFEFAVVPLFLLMSGLVSQSGIGQEAYAVARAWLGQVRGGLAMATVGACGLFAAASGSSIATSMAMGKVAYPEMKRYQYDSSLAAGCVAAGSSLGILIPPSLIMVVIGMLTEVSIGKLFVAGVIPGLLEILLYLITIYILCKRNPQLGPSVAKTTLKNKIVSLKGAWPIIVLFVAVMGGIYAGVFTPSEAGGVGAFGALVIALGRNRLSFPSLLNCLTDTARSSAMLIIILIGAFIFMRFLSMSRIPFAAVDFVAGLEVSRYFVLAIILITYLIFGMFFDAMACVIMTTPIIFPIVLALGFDPVWYGVILVRMVEIGLITPPFGLNLFALAGSANVSVGSMYKGIIPFVIADLFHVSILIVFPSLVIFLPSMM